MDSLKRKGRVLAIDFGTRRIGLAISDSERTVAIPLETIDTAKEEPLEAIKQIVENFNVTEIVIGIPKPPSGLQESRTLRKIKEFEKKLKAIVKLQIHEIDESLTSREALELLKEAGGTKRDKARIDKVAAMIILQEFLEREK